MMDYWNKTAGTLSYGGKDYAPGEKMPLPEKALKDPTVDWWIRSKFITTDEKSPVSQPIYIPTVDEAQETGRPVEMTEATATTATVPGGTTRK